MTNRQITMVRIYLREGEHLLHKIIKHLHDDAKVLGVTVFRGIEGFSEDGTIRTESLVGLSLDLPLVVEFFDDPDKAEAIVETLVDKLHLHHIISWPALAHTRV